MRAPGIVAAAGPALACGREEHAARGGGGSRFRLLGLVCALTTSPLAIPSALLAQTTVRDTLPVVEEVRIEGNNEFSDAQIKRAIATRDSGCKSFLVFPFCLLGWDAFENIERLDPRELRYDLARIRIFYFRRGYRQAEVDTAVTRGDHRVRVTFTVQEGEPVLVRSLELKGLEGTPGAGSVGRNLPLKEGQPFSEVQLVASRDRIERELGNRGYPEATVLVESSIPSTDTAGAHVVLDVMPGPRARIGAINVEGVDELDTADVKRLLTFRSGDLFRADEIVRSQRKLYSMALFNYVDISSEEVAADSTLDVRVRVSEADMHGVRFGIGLSTTECFQVEAGWTHRNLFGGTRRLELSGVLSNLITSELAGHFPCSDAGVEQTPGEVATDPFNKATWRLRADFQQPWFLGTENWLDLGVFSERQSLPRIYARVSYGGDLRFSRDIAPGTGLSLTYRAGRDVLEEGSADLLFCANFGICRPDDIARVSETRWLNWVSLGIARNRTDAVLDPKQGYRLSLEGEHASRLTGSQWAYYRTQAEVSVYKSLGEAVLALRARGGLVEPIGSGLEDVGFTQGGDAVTHPLKRQYAGGAYTVRGFGQNLLGPKILQADTAALVRQGCSTSGISGDSIWVCDPSGLSSNQVSPRPVGGTRGVVANAELRVPLGSRWSAVGFVDLGKVWTPGDARGGEEIAWSPGVGVRYRSPVGPVRLDIGYNTGEPERLPVVSQVTRDGDTFIVQITDAEGDANLFEYDPFGGKTVLQKMVNRLQLHFSIGQAF